MPGYTDFDTWFHEQEGTSLRSERFNGDVEWLKAAFDAGRSAQPSISTGQGAWDCAEINDWMKRHGVEGISNPAYDELRSMISLPAGHVAVPVEPTEEMKSSGMDVLMHRGDIYARDDGTVVIETITPADLWAAMLAALPHNQGEGK